MCVMYLAHCVHHIYLHLEKATDMVLELELLHIQAEMTLRP